MDHLSLRDELRGYTLSELTLIAATQRDVYSPEEMALIEAEIEQRKEAEDAARDESVRKDTLPCLLSLLLPPVGLFIGAMFLFSDDPQNKKTGKRCLLATFISLLLFSYFISGGIRI